jgi:glycine betaine/proline transport system substrate-binding protein
MIVGKRLLTLVLAASVAVLVLAGCGGGASSSSGGKTLTLGSIGWTENVAVSTLTQVVMQDELGYDQVQIKGPLELGPLFQGVASGDLQAFQDVWLPNNEDYLNNPQIKNDVELLKPWYESQTAYGIAVPDYMSNVQSLSDLNHAGTDQITGIEPSASFMPVIRNKVIPGYNLNVKLVESSTAAMLSELQKKYEAKEPIIFLAWSPHWMNAVYNFHYLKDPKGLEKPFSDPSRITTVVNEDLEKDDPEAYAFLNAISLDEEQVNEMEAEINKAGADNPEKGVRNWLKDNQDVVQPWVKAAKEAG